MRLVPKFEFALRSRCQVQILRNLFDRALEDCNAALEIVPNSVAALARRGDAYRGKDDLNAALSDYDKALNLNPNFVPGYVGAGNSTKSGAIAIVRGRITARLHLRSPASTISTPRRRASSRANA